MHSLRCAPAVLVVILWGLACGAPVPPTPPADDAAASLVKAELGFARVAGERGVPAAFLGVLADGGVVFRPGPVDGRTQFSNAPPSDALLTWEPTVAETSADGTLGFTSGPYRYLPDREADTEPSHGHYVSVWSREPGSDWRLAADIGIAHRPGIVVSGPPRTTPGILAPGASLASVQEIDRGARAEPCVVRAAEDLRVYRFGQSPAEGLESACELANATNAAASAEPLGGAVAGSGDLAFTYGAQGVGAERSAYLHLFRNEASGWRLLVDIAVPWPETAPAS